MSSPAKLFPYALANALAGTVKTSDTWKVLLVNSSYTFATSQEFYSSVSADEVTGTGYTAGGATVTTPTVTVTAASSWSVSWGASTAYSVGQVVRPATANGYVYECVVAGTSGSTAPTFPTVFGETVTDGTVTWVCAGESVVAISAGSASWTSSTITAYGAILYDAQTGVSTTDPLIAYIDFGGAVSSTNGTFEVSPDPALGYASVTPA